MNFTLIIGGLLLIVIILLVVWALRSRAKTREIEQQEAETMATRMSDVSDARYLAGERQASLVSEQIEEMVMKELDQFPELAETKIDFGTAADGSLEIWVDEQKYTDVSAIPDQRIRNAVSNAVRHFNQ
jgi:hypothetical protein